MDDAIIRQQKTGYYVTWPDGSHFSDAHGHGWFSKQVARAYAQDMGGMYHDGNKTTIKDVVIGYNPAVTIRDLEEQFNALQAQEDPDRPVTDAHGIP